MIAFGLGIGIFSYLILGLGLIQELYKTNIIILAIISLLIIIKYKARLISKAVLLASSILFNPKPFIKSLKNDKISLTLGLLLIISILINLIGALGPELSFDALWYHLTTPKLYLINHKIFDIPGGLLYYSNLPKLTEMLYTSGLAIGGTVLAKLIHFSFGIGCILALYNLLKKFGIRLAILGSLIFYSQLAVGWLSTTAYIDLARTFFEISALDFAIQWWRSNKKSYLIELGIVLGLAISTKLLAIFSLISIVILILIFKTKDRIKSIFVLIGFSFLIVFPWMVLSFINTQNPVYPLFTDWFFRAQTNGLMTSQWFASRDIGTFIKIAIQTVFTKADILSPLLLVGLPLVIFKLSKKGDVFFVSVYFLLNFFFFFMTPLNYNRFLLPYTPSFIFILIASIYNNKNFQKLIIYTTILIAILNILSRGVSNIKFIPVILGRQTEAEFMKKNLNFKAGNFYDIDGWFRKNIKANDKVLVIGVHNLYYVDFPFDHISWSKRGTFYTYIMTQNTELHPQFGRIPLIYKNSHSNVKVYSYNKVY